MEHQAKSQDFIRVAGTEFSWKGQPYFFMGTNLWYGMHLAAKGEDGNRDRLLRELDRLQSLGVKNLRIMAASEGPDTAPWRVLPTLMNAPGEYNDTLWDGLDFLLAEMGKREMHAVVCLNNFWPWSGGMAQYVNWVKKKTIPYPPPAAGGSWWRYMKYTSKFYKNKKAQKLFRQYLNLIINRKNKYSGLLYKNDPTIMAWQLANEPRGVLKARAMNRWIATTAEYIKSLDTNHLVTLGSEGNTSSFTAGNNFVKNHSSPYIDYTTIHIWAQNWLWYDPAKPEATYPKALEKAINYIDKHIVYAQQLNKPLVLEEFGISRDENDHSVSGGLKWRDQYFSAIFEKVVQEAQQGRMSGCNFWAWAGEGRPRKAEAIWKQGDDLIGDPPHEHQGWYSVYDVDESTLKLIQAIAKELEALSKK